MNTTLFSQFSPAIRDINTKADSPTLLLGAQGPLSIYYAPFDALNPQARVVLVGITPGRTQANNALAEALALAFVSEVFALVSDVFALVSEVFAFVSEVLAAS